MEYFASFGTALVPTMGLHKAVLHVLAKRYAIYPKARQNNDTLAISFKTYFRPKKMYQFEKKALIKIIQNLHIVYFHSLHPGNVEDWVKEQAPIIRILVTHALKLCKRSESSRSKRIGFFKTFMHKMMVDQGKWEILLSDY